ncbi:MAG: acetate kinase [Eubacteriales bacterium]
MIVLVVNAGSSSLKYQLIDTATSELKAKGLCERIADGGRIVHQIPGKVNYTADRVMNNHEEATKVLVQVLTDPKLGCLDSMTEIEAVGHRVVHGGPYFSSSVPVNDEVLAKLELCRDLAPLHTGPHLMGIRGCLNAMPGVPQVVVFDTAFHQSMPDEAYTYPISRELAEKHNIRRYGFHGTSHRYVSGEMIRLLGRGAQGTKIVTCHLGNGSSIAAVRDGAVIDTSMGFTPLAGVAMGTRCGDIDPAIVPFLMEKENMDIQEINRYLNTVCGLQGLAGASDLRDIEAKINQGDKQADLAMRVLSYGIKKYIGAYAAAMGGLDAIVFTAGVGENQPRIRELATAGLEFLGVKIDRAANYGVTRPVRTTCLSTPDSRVMVCLIPTDEEQVIARDTAEIVSEQRKTYTSA